MNVYVEEKIDRERAVLENWSMADVKALESYIEQYRQYMYKVAEEMCFNLQNPAVIEASEMLDKLLNAYESRVD